MKLITFYYEGSHRIGFLLEDKAVDINLALIQMYKEEKKGETIPQFPDMMAFLEGGEAAMELAKEAARFISLSDLQVDDFLLFDRQSIRLEAPLLKPGKIICVGQNYREHILEMNLEIPEYPVIFSRFSNCIIGPEDSVSLPHITRQLDYEAEFAFVMGKKAKNVSREKALEYVVGYTIGNDVSARDLQNRTSQWTQGKVLDRTFPMGPYLVTKDEVPHFKNLEISLYVNEEKRQHSNTENLVFDVEYLVEYLSGLMTLEPGDIILTGTPGGVGAGRTPQAFLQVGDVVEIKIESLGVLKNKIKREQSGEDYALVIEQSIDQIIEHVKHLPNETILWQPSTSEWSIQEILCHVEEAIGFWLKELVLLKENPGKVWGRTLNQDARLSAVSEAFARETDEVLKGIEDLKQEVRTSVLPLTEGELHLITQHRTKEIGYKPLSFFLKYCIVNHLKNHIKQILRTVNQYHSKLV